MNFRTRCARGPGASVDIGRPVAPPIVTSSTFAMESQAEVEAYYEEGRGWLYSRSENPTVRAAEAFLASLEGAEQALLFGSGMAAISSVFLALAGSGQRIAAQQELYGGTVNLLERVLPDLGIAVVRFDLEQLRSLRPEQLEGCRLLWLETPVNPTMRLVDLRAASAAARAAGVPVVVDGTFASPAFQRPLELGADLVVHSATKYLGGHSDLIAGALAGSAEWISRIEPRRRALGGICDPFSAFLVQRGMRTLAVRMEAVARGAMACAEALERHPGVDRVLYPGLPGHPDHALARAQMSGFGAMVSFEVRGGLAAATQVHDALRLFVRASSLGGVESLVSLPARMSHRFVDEEARRRAGVADGLIRLSVGIEAPEDLVADLMRALDATP